MQPGELYDVHEQCEQAYGAGSRLCPYAHEMQHEYGDAVSERAPHSSLPAPLLRSVVTEQLGPNSVIPDLRHRLLLLAEVSSLIMTLLFDCLLSGCALQPVVVH